MAINKTSEFDPVRVRFAQLAKALGHPARIAILEILAQKDDCMCGDITNQIPLAQSTVSQHLKVLKEAGLISGKISGASVCYDLNPDVMHEFAHLFEAFAGLTLRKKETFSEGDSQDFCDC